MFRWVRSPLLAPEDKGGSGNSDGSEDESGAEDAQKNKHSTDADGKTIYRQGQVDDIANQVRATERAKHEKARAADTARIAELEGKHLTAQDKAIRDAVKSATKDADAKVARVEKDAALKDALIEKGVHPKQMRTALALLREYAPEDADTDTSVAILKEHAPGVFSGASKFGPGDGANHDDKQRGTGWNPDKIEKATAGMKQPEFDAFMIKHGKDIEADRQSTSSVKVYAPGEPMHKE